MFLYNTCFLSLSDNLWFASYGLMRKHKCTHQGMPFSSLSTSCHLHVDLCVHVQAFSMWRRCLPVRHASLAATQQYMFVRQQRSQAKAFDALRQHSQQEQQVRLETTTIQVGDKSRWPPFHFSPFVERMR